MRINKYLAHEQYCTRREADELIQARKVLINGVPAQLGDKVWESDKIEVRFRPRKYRYFAYHKPRGVITHSPQGDEESIADISPVPGVFPIGRLDKDSYGLIILTDDGRITDALLNPDREHEKEYEVTTRDALTPSFKTRMEQGVDIGGYVTKPCRVELLGSRKFSITLTEGKKHQIRRMCGAFGHSATQLKRVRIMNVAIGNMRPNEVRPLEGAELKTFLKSIGIKA
jgi:23S rRNA pseudouridine2604 synthase